MKTALKNAARAAERDGWLSWFIFIVLIFIWGSSFILIKKGIRVFTPMQVGGIRMMAAGLSLLPLAIYYARSGKKYPWALLILVGITGNILPSVLFPLATTVLPSGIVGTLNSLTPLCVLIIGALFFGVRFQSDRIVGVLIGLAGSLALIIFRPNNAELSWATVGAGLIVMFCTFCYGFNLNIIRHRLSGLNSLEITSLSLQMAWMLGIGTLIASGDFSSRLTQHPEGWRAFGFVVLLGVMSTSLALLLFYKLVKMVGPVFAASNTYFVPFVALLWGLLDGEPLGWIQAVCLAVILLGVWLVNRPQPVPPAADAPKG